jgi:hypothetical protein
VPMLIWRSRILKGLAPMFTCGCIFEEGSWTPCPHHRLPEVGSTIEDEDGWREVVEVVCTTEEYGFWTMDRDGAESWTNIRAPWRAADGSAIA